MIKRCDPRFSQWQPPGAERLIDIVADFARIEGALGGVDIAEFKVTRIATTGAGAGPTARRQR